MPGLVLLVLSLGFMLFRVTSPSGQKSQGRPLRTVSLSLLERVRYQRTNLFAIGVILVLGAVGHWITTPFELLAIVAVYGILLIPVRYQITTEGVGVNRVVFRRWCEFASYTTSPRQILLQGRSGNGRFAIRLLPAHQLEVLPIVRHYVTPDAGTTSPVAATTRQGGARPEHTRRRRLLARRS